MDKKRLLIDFDDVICEDVMIKKVNKFLGTNLTINDFTDYLIDSVIPEDKKDEFYATLADIHYYDDCCLVDGAKEVLEKLNEKYDVFIVSSCIIYNYLEVSSYVFASKYNFLLKNLPFLDPKKFVFTASKQLLKGDIIIDDYFSNLKGDIPQKFLFTAYHNKHFTEEQLKERNVFRLNDWKDIEKALL